MNGLGKRALQGASIVVLSATTSTTRADDGLYGRFDGDLALSAEVGVSEAFVGGDERGELVRGRVTALYLWSAGAYLDYGDGLGIERQPLARALSGGLQLRPLFLGRFARDLEQGPALLDLFIDAIHIDLGLYQHWLGPRASYAFDGTTRTSEAGVEWGFGVELPLVPQADAPFIVLRGTLRRAIVGRATPTGLLSLGLGYHMAFDTGLVDLGDRLDPDQ